MSKYNIFGFKIYIRPNRTVQTVISFAPFSRPVLRNCMYPSLDLDAIEKFFSTNKHEKFPEQTISIGYCPIIPRC